MNYIHNYKMLALCMILSIGLAACAGGDNISENGTEDLISRPQITDSSATLTDEMVIDIRFAMESKVAKKLGNVESLQVGASVSIGSQNMAESQQTISNALLSICGAGKASKDTAGNHICACSAGAVNIGGENKLSKCECSGLGLIQNGTDCLCDYENGFEGASEIGCECKYGFALNNDYICVPILENTVQVDCGAFEFDSTKEKCKCEGTGVTFAADYWSCFTCDASKGLVPDDDELGCKCDAEIGMIGNGVNTINGPEACVCDENNDWHQTNENPLQCIYQNCGYGIFDSDTKKCIADESKGLTLLDDGSYNCNAENNQTYINGSCQCKPGYTLTVFEEKSEKPFSEKECRKIPKTIEGIKLDIKTDYWTDDIDPDEISVKFTMGEDELKEPITYEVNLEDDAVKIEGSIAADKTITAQFDGDKSWKALRQLLLKELEINEVELKFDNKGDAQWPIEGIRLSIKYLGEADWKTILYNPCIKRKLQKYRSYASTWDEYWAQYDLADRTQYKNIIKASIYDVSFCFEIDISSDPNSEYNGGHDKLRLAVEMKEEATEAKEYEKKYDILWQSYDDFGTDKKNENLLKFDESELSAAIHPWRLGETNLEGFYIYRGAGKIPEDTYLRIETSSTDGAKIDGIRGWMFRPGDPEFVKTKKGEFSSKINITKQEFQDKSKDGTGCIDKNNGGGNHWPWDGFEDAHFSTEIPGNEALFNDSTLIWQPYKHE